MVLDKDTVTRIGYYIREPGHLPNVWE